MASEQRNGDEVVFPPKDGGWCYFTEFSISNIRCFGPEQTLDLTLGDDKPARWTVIIGENGTGKTTLLQALALMVMTEPRQSSGDWDFYAPLIIRKPPIANDWQFGVADLRKQKSAVSRLWANTLTRMANSNAVEAHDYQCIWPSPDRMSGGRFPDPESDFPVTPCFAYGALRRVQEPSTLDSAPVEYGYETLFSDAIGLTDPAELIAQEYLVEMFEGNDAPAKKEHAARRRVRLERALIEVLPDVAGIEAKVENRRPVILFETPYGKVRSSQLSSGYRAMAAWVADLVGRMFDAYPDSEDPLSEPAIVLVDEFDLHLHPKWQRESIGYLTERFPATQFIVTAHSPLVVQSAPDVNVAVLRHKDDHVVIDNDPVSIATWRIDQIMTSELFGLDTARNPEVQAKLDERVRLLKKPTLTEDEKARVKELEAFASSVPEAESPSELRSLRMLEELTEHLRMKLDGDGPTEQP